MGRVRLYAAGGTLTALPRPTAAWITAFVALIAARIFLSAIAYRFDTVPNGDLDTFVYFAKENEYRADKSPTPRYLLLGTSRTQFLSSAIFAEALGCQPSEAGSFGFAASNFWHHRLYLERNPNLLASCEVLLIECMPSSLYRVEMMAGKTRTVFARFASVEDRLSVEYPSLKAEALADVVFPVVSYRNNAIGWRVFANQLGLSYESALQEYVTPGTLTYRAAQYRPTVHITPDMIIDMATPAPVPNVPARNALHKLMRGLSPKCRVVFWIPPLRGDFNRAIARDPEANTTFAAFRRELESIADARTRIVWHDDPGCHTFAEEDFVDPEHFVGRVVRAALAPEAARLVRETVAEVTQ